MVVAETRKQSLSHSPWMRRSPQPEGRRPRLVVPTSLLKGSSRFGPTISHLNGTVDYSGAATNPLRTSTSRKSKK